LVCAVPYFLYIIASNFWEHLAQSYLGYFEWVARALGALPAL
jgi:hypothetical protein